MVAFEMLCERLGRIEDTLDQWLRRERDREVDKGGKIDGILMRWDWDVTLLWQRPGWGPRGVHMTWRAMRISAPDDGQPANPLGKGRLITGAAMEAFDQLTRTVGTHHLKSYMSGAYDRMLRDFQEL